MKILYFAWLRERIGKSRESETPPAEITTVAALLDWLATLSPAHAEALETRSVVRVSVNQEFAESDAAVAAGDEVALFPPMTGG